jgi:hypothetical protein
VGLWKFVGFLDRIKNCATVLAAGALANPANRHRDFGERLLGVQASINQGARAEKPKGGGLYKNENA